MAITTTKRGIEDAAFVHGVPDHLVDGFVRYVICGVPTGSGIRRILEHRDVFEVVGGLDHTCQFHLAEICAFIENTLPEAAHGSPEAVEAWVKRGGVGLPKEPQP